MRFSAERNPENKNAPGGGGNSSFFFLQDLDPGRTEKDSKHEIEIKLRLKLAANFVRFDGRGLG